MIRQRGAVAAPSLLICLALAAVLLGGVRNAGAAYPGANGKIAYESDDGVHSGIWVMRPDGTGQTPLTAGGVDRDPVWSPSGAQIAFSRSDPNPPEGHMNVYVMNADGSGPVNLTPGANDGQGHTGIEPTWSPDGTKIAYNDNANIWTMDASGGNKVQLTTGAQQDSFPTWSPDGTKIAFSRDLDVFVMNANGSALTPLTSTTAAERGADWSPNGTKIVYERSGQVWSMNADGSNQVGLTGGAGQVGALPAWSPDGTKIVFSSNGFTAPNGYDIFTMNPDGTGVTRLNMPVPVDERDPNWQPAPAPIGYPRPKGASPLRASLVPAYQSCGAPNRTHGAPLAFGSCAPPLQASSQLTVGSPDANGAGANSIGTVIYKVVAGDVRIDANVTDVRQKTTLGDYTGELRLDASVRITDKRNGPSETESATVSDAAFPATVPCAATTATTVGSTCSVSTTFNAVAPGAIIASARAIWEVGAMRVFDGGPDGVASTSPNTLFMTQGVFAP